MDPRLFVYGTLRPGDVRWPLLARWVADEGVDDAAAGLLFDTGLGYPAALFAPVDHPDIDGSAVGSVRGRTYQLRLDTIEEALAALDEEEDTVDGLYHRVEITTFAGHRAWAYSYGRGLELTPIDSGDWFDR